MKYLTTYSGKLLLVWSAMGLGAALAAPPIATVYQRTDNTESIELSNLADDGTEQKALTLEVPAAATGAGATEARAVTSARSTPPKARKKVLKKVVKPDGTEVEQWVDSEEDSDSADGSGGVGTEPGTRSAAQADGAGYQGNSMHISGGGFFGGSGGSTGSSGYSNSGGGSYSSGDTSTGTVSTGASGGASSSGTGSTTSTTSTATSTPGTATTPSTTSTASTSSVPKTTSTAGTGGAAPVATSALQTKLETYRDMMLTEVTSAQVSNPALTRRYQMMDRATYQTRVGQ